MLTLVGKLAPSWINESDLYGVYIGKWRPWPYETLEHSLVSIGRSLVYIVVATKVFAENAQSSLCNFLSVFGRFSLTLFTLHHFAIYATLATQLELESSFPIFENAFHVRTSLLCASVFVLLAHRLCVWLERESIPSLEDVQKYFCNLQLGIITRSSVSTSKKND